VNGEDMRGQSHSGEALMKFWERKHYFEGRTAFSVWFGVWGGTVTGVHQVVGSFGLGGQESSWNLGAREPDRLCS